MVYKINYFIMKKAIIILVLLQGSIVQGQNEEKALLAYLKSSSALWEQVVNLESTQHEIKASEESLFSLAMSEYGLLNSTMADQNEALFDKYIDLIDDHLEQLEEANYRLADIQALQSAVAGLKIAYSPWKGMILGPKAGYLIDVAVENGEESPIVQKMLGNYLLFTPETWGGDTDRAIKAYNKAIAGFEKFGETKHWLYLDALVWKSQALIRKGKKDEAVAVLEKAKEIAPDFIWVTEVLLPAAKKS